VEIKPTSSLAVCPNLWVVNTRWQLDSKTEKGHFAVS